VFAKGYGLANLDDGIPITRMTSFHLASLSKQFTAAAIALLILDHKIALSDPVAKYLPEVSKYGNGLRIEHLVYMTSGLHEYTDEPRKNGAPWMTFYYFTRDEAIAAALRPDQLEFAPGTKWAYRNINYMLLTKIVEVVSHESFATFMHDRVFVPLGMSHSEINDDSTEVIPHRATGYALRSDPRVLKELAQVGVVIKPGDGWARLVRVAPHFGGSGVFTTLNDLLLWDRNWYAGTLAGPQFTELMNKRMKFEHDKDNDALGLVWRSSYGHPMLDYSGGDTDTSTYMARFRRSTSRSSVFRTCRLEMRKVRRTQCWIFSTVGASCRDCSETAVQLVDAILLHAPDGVSEAIGLRAMGPLGALIDSLRHPAKPKQDGRCQRRCLASASDAGAIGHGNPDCAHAGKGDRHSG
jgi:CubicO group peptidase (beta-lactamase class C family)